MRRLPLSLFGLTLIGALLGGWMTLEGLYIRMFDKFMSLKSLLGFWPLILGMLRSVSNPLALQLAPQDFAWPLLAIGLAWVGALTALWLRLEWGYRVTAVIGVLSIFTLGLGSVLALAALICLRALPKQNQSHSVGETNVS